MGKMKTETGKMDMVAMANDVTLHLYEISRMNEQRLFKNISVIEYIAIGGLSSHIERSTSKIYLKNIAKYLQLSMVQISKIVKELQERGLVEWNHDGRGEEGTYIQVTSLGMVLVEEQHEILKEHYRNVMDKFGQERLINLMAEIKELYSVTNQEIEFWETNE